MKRTRFAMIAIIGLSLPAAAVAQLRAPTGAPKRPLKGIHKAGPPAATRHRHQQMHIVMGGQGQLGAQVSSMTPELRAYFHAPKDRGILVGQVEADTPAARAGLAVGDVVVTVAGEAIEGPMDVAQALVGKKQGDVVEIGIVRAGAPQTLRAELDRDAGPVMGMGAWRLPFGDPLNGKFDFNFDGDFDGDFDGAWGFGGGDEPDAAMPFSRWFHRKRGGGPNVAPSPKAGPQAAPHAEDKSGELNQLRQELDHLRQRIEEMEQATPTR